MTQVGIPSVFSINEMCKRLLQGKGLMFRTLEHQEEEALFITIMDMLAIPVRLQENELSFVGSKQEKEELALFSFMLTILLRNKPYFSSLEKRQTQEMYSVLSFLFSSLERDYKIIGNKIRLYH